MTARPQQLDGLTAARGLAAWMVVLFHIRSGMPWLPEGVMRVLDKGYLSVDFFFLLSGFVIYLSAHEAFLAEGAHAVPAFLRRRLARIYPLYGAMLALTILFAALLTTSGRDTNGYPWAELPLHMLMLQNWGFTDALSWNHPAWSISTEMAAYLLFPLIVLVTPISRAPRRALICGIGASIAIMASWLHLAGLGDLGQDIPHFGLVRCLFEFSAGCMLCALWLKSEGAGRGAYAIAAMLISGAALGWAVDGRNELWAFPAITACVIFLIAKASRGRLSSVAMRPLVWLGEISCATYLSHFMLFIWFKITLVRDANDISPPMIALFLLLTLAASAILYHAVEKPGRRLAGHKSQRANCRASVA